MTFEVPQEKILQIMQEVIDKFLIPRFYQLNMDATGEWVQSLQAQAQPNKGIIKGRPYTEQLVNGRAPGERPPIAPLERWVNAKLGIHGSQGKSIAFAVANKIAKEGTTWYEKSGSNLLEVLEEIETLRYINERVGDIMSAEVEIAIQRQLQEIWA